MLLDANKNALLLGSRFDATGHDVDWFLLRDRDLKLQHHAKVRFARERLDKLEKRLDKVEKGYAGKLDRLHKRLGTPERLRRARAKF
jgi:hypothetical protein